MINGGVHSFFNTPAYTQKSRLEHGDDETLPRRSLSVDSGCDAMIEQVYTCEKPIFVPNILASSNLPEFSNRKDLLIELGIKSLCFIPCETWVIEFGSDQSWNAPPKGIVSTRTGRGTSQCKGSSKDPRDETDVAVDFERIALVRAPTQTNCVTVDEQKLIHGDSLVSDSDSPSSLDAAPKLVTVSSSVDVALSNIGLRPVFILCVLMCYICVSLCVYCMCVLG